MVTHSWHPLLAIALMTSAGASASLVDCTDINAYNAKCCTCTTPGQGTAGFNEYTCRLNGVQTDLAHCQANEYCYATYHFAYGDWAQACSTATPAPTPPTGAPTTAPTVSPTTAPTRTNVWDNDVFQAFVYIGFTIAGVAIVAAVVLIACYLSLSQEGYAWRPVESPESPGIQLSSTGPAVQITQPVSMYIEPNMMCTEQPPHTKADNPPEYHPDMDTSLHVDDAEPSGIPPLIPLNTPRELSDQT